MHCIHCGSEIPDQSTFCVTCGGRINSPSSQETGASAPSGSSKGLFTPKGKRIAVIAGISAASVILVGALIFGSVALFSSLQKDTPSSHNSSGDTPDPFDTGDGETTDAVIPSETEATLSQNEIDANTYGQYITDTLVPTYGLANLEMFRLNCQWWAGFMDLTEFMPEDRKGIVSAQIEDINGDGDVELIVVIARTFADPVLYTNGYDDYTFEIHEDGVEIKVFHIVGGVVQEMFCDNREMVYPEVFTYTTDESLQICILENGAEKYIYVYNFNLYNSEQSTDLFRHDIYQVTDTGIHCLNSMTTTNGKVYDALDPTGGSMGTELFSIWSGDLIGDYYSAIQNNLSPYGLDCSWMDSYYDVIEVDTDFNTTFSSGMNQSFTPLSAMISNIEVIAMAGGTFEYSPDTGDPIQSFLLLNMVNGPVAQSARIIPFPNAQVEAEVTVIRDIWTADRDNITAGTYTVAAVAPGVVSYHNGTEVVMIEIADGTDGKAYARTYEYRDGQLIFAFFDKSGAGQDQRLYFNSGVLFRWRMNEGTMDPVNNDNAVGNAKYLTLEREALEEGMQVLAQANGL
jgi:hypothetical protein